jgi:hypothetical protein
MNQLGGSAGSAGGKVISLKQNNPKATRGRIKRNAQPRGPAADHQHIHRLSAKCFKLCPLCASIHAK